MVDHQDRPAFFTQAQLEAEAIDGVVVDRFVAAGAFGGLLEREIVAAGEAGLIADCTAIRDYLEKGHEVSHGRGVVTPRCAAILVFTDGVELFTAIQQQLGLKLDATKAAAPVMVIDRAEKPSGN